MIWLSMLLGSILSAPVYMYLGAKWSEDIKMKKTYDIPHIGKVECTEAVAVKLELLIYKAAHYEFLEARKERDMIYPFPTDDEEWKRHINNSNNYYEASNYLFRENIGYWSDLDRKGG